MRIPPCASFHHSARSPVQGRHKPPSACSPDNKNAKKHNFSSLLLRSARWSLLFSALCSTVSSPLASAMSKRGASSQAIAAPADNKKSRTDGQSNAAAAAAASTSGAAASSATHHSGKRSHAHHGPLPLTTSADQSLRYLPGFGCELQSEALPHALPVGQNSPQVSETHYNCLSAIALYHSSRS